MFHIERIRMVAQDFTVPTAILNFTVMRIAGLIIKCIPILFLFAGNAGAQSVPHLTTGSIERMDAALEQLLPSDTKVEIIGSGFQHIEGPVWLPDSSILLFSDTKAGKIYRWSAAAGLSVFLDHAGYTGRLPYSEEPGSNGLALDNNGNLLVCEHGDRRIAKFPLHGKSGLVTITDAYKGKRYNSPNDIIVKNDGTLYFSDPAYGLPQKDQDPLKETSQNGVYRLKPNGQPELVITDLMYPNGLAFSPDETKLYVSVSDIKNPRIMVYSVSKDGSLSTGKIFFDASSLPKTQAKEVTDGLKVDYNGNLWASGPAGLLIISPSGKLSGVVHTEEIVSNCAWGDDGSSLYITAGNSLYRIKTKSKAAGKL